MADEPVGSSRVPRDILDANNPAAECHIASIREFVSLGTARRAFLDAKMAPLKAELHKLLEECESLDTEIRKHEGALSPLRRMPTEIMSLIFTFASPPFSCCRRGISWLMSSEEGPWVLSAVCSRWRNIALSQPNLWAYLFLDFTDDPPDSPSVAVIAQMLEVHLERSQKLPLDITFSPFYETHCTDVEQQILDLIVLHCSRWETVTLRGSPEMYSTLMVVVHNKLPMLRKLCIDVCPRLDEAELDILNIFDSCPALQEVFVNSGRYGGETPVTADLPSAQLLRYSASNPWTHHVLVLRSATNLVDCVLRLIGAQNIPTGSPLVLPHLRRLSTSTASVLGCLETPVLEELYCCDHSSSLHSYLKRLPKLQKLFVGETTSAADVGLLLHAAATITNLFLYLPMRFAPDLFSLLENPAARNQMAAIPALHTISLCLIPLHGSLGPFDEDRLMRVVESQWQIGRLRCLRLYATSFKPSATTLERMEALRGEGMQIVVAERSEHLYVETVPNDFQLHEYSIYERFLSD